MQPDGARSGSERVIVVAPTSRDGQITCTLLENAGIDCATDKAVGDVPAAIAAGIGAIVLTDIALADGRASSALAALEQQPEWSSLPILLLCRDGLLSPAARATVTRLRNVIVLDRPSSTSALVSAVRAALRGRRWQYELRDQMKELELAEAKLRRADRRKDEFLATLAHELRNPLAPIRSGVQLLGIVRSDEAQFGQVRSMMDRQISQLVRLIDDLLDVTRITTGKLILQRQHIDLRDVVRAAVETCEPGIRAAGHTLSVVIPDDPVRVIGDHVRLAQAVANVINNAVKYTPERGSIAIALRREGDEAVISVRDNGVGIPADMLAAVFDLFAQVNSSLGRSQGGLGIGLSLVRSLIDLHGGRVQVQSEGGGRGSEFSIYLPALASAP